MGKAANRRMMRRQKFLIRLAQDDPERFGHEWAKRVDSWASLIWSALKDRVFLTGNEYQELAKKYPSAKEALESVSVGLYNSVGVFKGVHIYLNALNECKEELGSEVISEILSHAKKGTLIGKPIFGIVDHAKKTLADCGEAAVALQFRETTDLLSNECCRAMAPHIGRVIYRIGQSEEFSKAELFKRKRRVKHG